MQVLRFGLVAVAAFLAGWFAHSLTVEEVKERNGRRGSVEARRDGRVVPVAPEFESPVVTPPAVEIPKAPEESTAAPEARETAKKKDPLEEFFRSQSAMWVGFATMQAKGRLKGLLADLGFDEETAAAIQEAILAEVARQTERAIQMMLGTEDLDADAFAYFMGLPPDLSTELSGELGTFLDDDEIASVRAEVKKAYKEQLTAMADMQINMMRIGDLSDDQRIRMREIFSTDVMKEQMVMLAEVTRDRRLLTRLANDPKMLNKAMKENLAPTRDRVREILSDQQFEKYSNYEQSMIKQAEMGLKMMGSLTQPPPKETPEPGGR
jgi:hypothetical protein